MTRAYYNENDPGAAAWLRELIADHLIAPGDVDERSIVDVRADDVQGYMQCHWFAGIGGWSLALRLAGVPDDAPVWTGSCPCQPVSCAGSKRGHADERHLWPEFYRLIRECRPPVCFGEQVTSGLGPQWLAGVRADLETADYAVAAADLCAAGVGAPHIRQRLYWVAHRGGDECGAWRKGRTHARQASEPAGLRSPGGVGHGVPHRCEGIVAGGAKARAVNGACSSDGLAEPLRAERPPFGTGHDDHGHDLERPQASGGAGACGEGVRGLDNARSTGARRDDTRPTEPGCDGQNDGIPRQAGQWSDARWHYCRDGKHRRVPTEPSLFPLAHGLPERVGLLRGAGNAIVPPLAATFVRCALEVLP